MLERGELPLNRALRPTEQQCLIREMILQLKRGYLDREYFQSKFHVDILEHWRAVWAEYIDEGWAVLRDGRVELTRQGLLRVDGLLPAFFEPEHREVRYT